VAHLYEVALSHTTSTAAAHIATVVTAAGARAEIREIGVFATTAAAGEVCLGRPAAAGTGTLSTTALGQALDAADAVSVTNLCTVFGTLQPTAPTVFFRKIQLPALVGAGIVWVWAPGELIVPVSANLCIWQASAVAVGYDCYIKYVE
jgi:hypothetical protein